MKEYHTNVIDMLLQMRKEKNPLNDSTRQAMSKFALLYKDSIKELQKSLEETNSELYLKLDTDTKKLLPTFEISSLEPRCS